MAYEYVRHNAMNDLNEAPDTEVEDGLLAVGYRVHSEQTIAAGMAGTEVITLTLYERYVEEPVKEPEPMRIT